MALPAHWTRISEKAFTRQVIQLAQHCGYKVAHFRPAMVKCKTCRGRGCRRCTNTGMSWRTAVEGDGKGFVDLVMVHRKKARLIFAELKSETGKVDDDQNDWIECLLAVSDRLRKYGSHLEVIVHVWKPSDIANIEQILKG